MRLLCKPNQVAQLSKVKNKIFLELQKLRNEQGPSKALDDHFSLAHDVIHDFCEAIREHQKNERQAI